MQKLIISQIVLYVLSAFVTVSAQDVLLLKVNAVNPDGTLVEKDLQYEIHDDSKLHFLVKGERTEEYLELKLQPLEKLADGTEITGYDILSDENKFVQLGIVDRRHLDIDVRKASMGLDYPLMVMMVHRDESKKPQLFKAELIKGGITKNGKRESGVTFQMQKDKSMTMKLEDDKLKWLSDGSQFAFLNLVFEKEVHLQEEVFHYYKAEGLGYTNMFIVDLRNMEVSTREEKYKTSAPIIIGLQKGEDDAGSQMDAEIIEGDLIEGKVGTDDIQADAKEETEKIVKTKAEVEDELRGLFKDLANGFKETIKWDAPHKRDDRLIYGNQEGVKIELGAFTSSGMLEMVDKSYRIRVLASENDDVSDREQLIEGLSSFQDNEFKLTNLESEGKHFTYLIEQSNRAIGFIELRKGDDGNWIVLLSSRINSAKLKADIIEKLTILESDPTSLKGEVLNEKEHLYEPTTLLYGANFGQYLNRDGAIVMMSAYELYPTAGLHYMVKELDIEISGREKNIRVDGESEDGEKGLFISYDTDEDFLSLTVARGNSFTILQLSNSGKTGSE